MYFIYGCIFVIFYNLLNIYLLHFFSNPFFNKKSKKERIVPEVFPEFIFTWLKEFKIKTSSKDTKKVFKTIYYREVLLYSVLLVLSFFLISP